MAWFKPWKLKNPPKIQETKIKENTIRLTPQRDPANWSDTPIAPSNENFGRKKVKKRTYYETYQDNHWNDDDYYNESAFPTHGQISNSQINGVPQWKNGKMVRNHKMGTGYNTFNKPAVKKAYTYNSLDDRWTNYGYGGIGFGMSLRNDDDNSRLFIAEPPGYITPSAKDIKYRLLVHDVNHTDIVKNLARLFYFKLMDEKDYIIPDIKDKIGNDSYAFQKEYYKKAYDTYVPGNTPLEKATTYYQAILDKQRSKGGTGSGNDDISFKREDFNNPTLNELMRKNPKTKNEPIKILSKVALVNQLGYEFHVEKEIGEREVPNAFTYKPKTMTSYSQIDRIALYQRVLPTYRFKFLTKSLQVNIPVESNEKKQKIIILVDFSGSMNSDDKQEWVRAIIADRLRYVIEGEAEIFFSFFVEYPHELDFSHIKDKQSAMDFWQKFYTRPNGGNTDIGRIVKYVSNEVKRGKGLHNLKNLDLSKEQPEILIINDGQDYINVNKFPYKVNAISLLQFSDQLKDLCVATGGKQVQVTQENEIFTYSSEGEKILQT